MTLVRLLRVGAASVAFALLSSNARAQTTTESEALFEEGTALLDEGRYDEALVKLEEAQRSDPGLGTQFNIAVCHEQLGRLATALREFEEVAENARAAGKVQRERAARTRIGRLTPRVPALVVRADERDATELILRIDGAIVDRSRWSLVRVDPGEHTIDAGAPMKRSWSTKTSAPPEGRRVVVVVPPLELAPGETKLVTVTKETTNTRRTLGFIFGGVGLAGAVAAGVTGVMLLDARSTAEERCKPRCVDAEGEFDRTGSDAVSRGKTLLPINAVAWAVAVGGIGVGAFFILTSGKHTTTVRPTASPSSAGVSVSGGF